MPNEEPVTGLSSALRAMVARDFMRSEKHGDQLRRADRAGADERILLFENRFVTRMQKLGVPMFAHVFVRSEAEQTAAFVRGRSKARAGQSPHQYGLAVELIHGVKGWSLPRESWVLIGHIGKEVAVQNGLKLVWGGDFKSLWDPAHWELANWREIAGIR